MLVPFQDTLVTQHSRCDNVTHTDCRMDQFHSAGGADPTRRLVSLFTSS